MMIRFPLTVLALAVLAAGFGTLTASAQTEKAHDKHGDAASHEHAAGQDESHATMEKAEKAISTALATLSPEDQKLAAAQRFCPIMEYSRLGSDGAPVKIMISGKPVFVCCKGCVDEANKDGQATLKKAQTLTKVSATLAKLPMEERMAIEAQKYCAVQNNNFLGTMGAPVKLEIDGKPVYLCCAGCKKKAEADPAATLAKVEELKHAGMQEDHGAHGQGDAPISPALSLDEHAYRYQSPTVAHDVLIFTGSGLMGREVVNIRSSDIVAIVGGSSGTLGELAIAYDEGKLIGVLTGTGGISDMVEDILKTCNKETGGC